jgi:hypothetical protein
MLLGWYLPLYNWSLQLLTDLKWAGKPSLPTLLGLELTSKELHGLSSLEDPLLIARRSPKNII